MDYYYQHLISNLTVFLRDALKPLLLLSPARFHSYCTNVPYFPQQLSSSELDCTFEHQCTVKGSRRAEDMKVWLFGFVRFHGGRSRQTSPQSTSQVKSLQKYIYETQQNNGVEEDLETFAAHENVFSSVGLFRLCSCQVT